MRRDGLNGPFAKVTWIKLTRKGQGKTFVLFNNTKVMSSPLGTEVTVRKSAFCVTGVRLYPGAVIGKLNR